MNYLPQSQYNVDLTGISLMYAAFSTSATPNGVINAGNVMVSTSGSTMESNSSAVPSTSATMGTHRFSPNTSGVDGSSTNGTASTPISNKVFVGNLSSHTDATKLWDYFLRFGIIQDAVVILDPQTQCSRKFGFVTFDDPAIVQKVLGFSQHFLEGQKLIVKPAAFGIGKPQRKNVNPLSTRNQVFLGGISQSTTKEDIEDYFSKSGYGKAQETYIPVDPSKKNRHRGFAFVTFESETTVDLICNTHFHTIKDATVESKRATSRKNWPTFVGLPAKRLCDVAQAQAGNPIMMTPTLKSPYYPDLGTMGHHLQPRIIGNHRYMPYQHHSNAVNLPAIQTVHQPYETPLMPVACPPQFDWRWFDNALM